MDEGANVRNVRIRKCKYCDNSFSYATIDCKWDYKGSIDTKIITCPLCNRVNIIRYWDSKIQNPNTDNRYFF